MADSTGLGEILSASQFANLANLDPVVQQAIRRHMYAQQLMKQGSDASPVASWAQAAARALQGGLGGVMQGLADESLEKYAQGSRDALVQQYQNTPLVGFPPLPGGDTTPAPAAPAGGAGASGAAPSGTFASAIGGHEGTGQNPRSSASGTGQFIDPTWRQFAAENPERFKGMSDAEIMAKRSDPEYGNAAIAWYATKNAQQLTAAGVPVNGVNLALAHRFGPGLGIAVAQAPDGTPVADIVRNTVSPGMAAKIMAANPDLANTTAGAQRAKYAAVPTPPELGGQPYKVASAGETPPPPGQTGGQAQPGAPQITPESWGMQQAQMWRDRAIQAAQSPYAAVRALAPEYMKQATAALQAGRYVATTNPSTGQRVMVDRATGKQEPVGSAPNFVQAPGGGYQNPALTPPTAPNVARPGTPPDAAENRARGVPAAPGINPYSGMTQDKAQEAYQADRAKDQEELNKGNEDVAAARETKAQIARARELNKQVQTGSDIGSKAAMAAMRASNDARLQELEKLQSSLVASSAKNSGLGRISDADMKLLEKGSFSLENSRQANQSVLAALERRADQVLEQHLFRRDYFETNGTLRGADTAWDAYTRSNPLFVPGKGGAPYEFNPDHVDRRTWFAQNMDEQGRLRPGAGTPPKETPKPQVATPKPGDTLPEGTIVKAPNGTRYIVRNGQLAPL